MALLSNHKLQLSHLRADQRPEPEPEVAEQEAKEVPTRAAAARLPDTILALAALLSNHKLQWSHLLDDQQPGPEPVVAEQEANEESSPLNPGLGLGSCDCSVSMVPGLSSYFSLCDHVIPPGPY
ncbi:hypothetical protein ACOMHN_017116 [Nucella lapillus]